MAATYHLISPRQQEISKIYETLCHRYGRFEVWQDFVQVIACAISNSVDLVNADAREARYMNIVKKYARAEVEAMGRVFGAIVNGMEEQPDSDFLGELYMILELGNKHSGQFFTPYHVSRLMAHVTLDAERVRADIAREGWASLSDCACGAGAMLVAAANRLREVGIDYQRDVLFIGQDIDYTVGLMCYIQLSLRGCAGYVRIGDTLREPLTGNVLIAGKDANTWITPMYFSDHWTLRRLRARREAREAARPVEVVSGLNGQMRFDFGGET